MPGVDLTRFVTRDELRDRLDAINDLRDMMRDDMRGLHEGQSRIEGQVASMKTEICERMDEANHRTTHLEEELEATEKKVDSACEQMQEVKADAHEANAAATKVLNFGCKKMDEHGGAVQVLAKAGIIEPLDDAPLAARQEQWKVTPKKVGFGAGLVGLGFTLPHIFEVWKWIWNLVMGTTK